MSVSERLHALVQIILGTVAINMLALITGNIIVIVLAYVAIVLAVIFAVGIVFGIVYDALGE